MPFRLPRWIAHRGGGSSAPENTLLGIRRAAAAGFQAVEFDVMLSRNGTPVLFHDETLERTTNGSGRVSDTPDDILFALDAGEGERVPSLKAALQLCQTLNLAVNLEIKPAGGFEIETAQVAVAQAELLWSAASPVLLYSSFSPAALAVARRLAPARPRGLLFEKPPEDWPARLRELEATTLHCAAKAIDESLLQTAAALSVPVLAYTVNERSEAARLFAQGVSAVFTDCLDFCRT